MKKRNLFKAIALSLLAAATTLPLSACNTKKEERVVLRVCSWEEYIDLGKWEDDELIDIDNPYAPDLGGVIGNNSMVDDFTKWFNVENDFGFKVKVEYSTFGTNEDLYNRLNLGDVYDLVCPSDYMIMQLIREGRAKEFSASFRNKSIDTNYYAKYVSTFIDDAFKQFGGEEYAAGYMWGTTGIVYNHGEVAAEDVSTWNILRNKNYARKVTIKDNVRDSYFPALGILNRDKLLSGDGNPGELLNDTDDETIAEALEILKEIKENVYSFETDSGKADMITGKVLANYQWSGDAVFIMDEADDDEKNEAELWYSVPDECTNLWFDGWVMLKDGVGEDERKMAASEAFVNFLSRPDNAIRNMYYIGYTSAIAGDKDNRMVYDYVDWNYGVEDGDAEMIVPYDVSNFFGTDFDPILVDGSTLEIDKNGAINRGRQLFAQYPPKNITDRSVIMDDFGDRLSAINQMWINVRCLDVKDFNPAVVWSVVGIVMAGGVALTLYKLRYKIFYRTPKTED